MKHWNLTQKLTSRVFLIFSALILFASIAGTTNVSTASLLPVPDGYVKVKLNQQEHYVIQLYLNNLIQPAQLPDAKKCYVVWMVSDRGITKNIGAINQTSTIFGHSIKKTLRPDTPLKPAQIYITAEDDAAVQYSQTEKFFSTSVFVN